MKICGSYWLFSSDQHWFLFICQDIFMKIAGFFGLSLNKCLLSTSEYEAQERTKETIQLIGNSTREGMA